MRSIIVAIAFCLILGSYSCAPTAHPTTYEEMVQYYRTAHESKNLKQVERVVYWGNMPANVRKRIFEGIKRSFDKTIDKVELGPLPDDFEMKSGDLIYPITPEKTLKASYQNPNNQGGVLVGKEYTLGKKDGKVYILFRLNPKE